VSQTRLALVLGILTAVGPLSIDTQLPAFPAIAAEFGGADISSALMRMPAVALGSVAAAAASLLADGTVRPMAVLILLGGIGAVLAERWRRRTLPPRSTG
jgi:DHA1 family bicyclomycin/chloramphenicol resistance-like MFS transporter